MLSPRPLVPTSYVQSLLDVTESELQEFIDDGMLIAWNISRNPLTRRELRVLLASVSYYAGTSRPLPADADDLVADLFPPDLTITTATLGHTLNCSPDHVSKLVNSKAIILAPGERLRRGPGAAAKVDRLSAIAFLKARAVV